MKTFYHSFLLIFIFLLKGCNQPDSLSTMPDPVTILTTDLSLDKDPDDWFDTFLFLTLPKINPVGIILENYATDSVKDKAIEFSKILGNSKIPILKGIQQPLEFIDGVLTPSDYTEGAEFILQIMEKSKGRVRLIAVGSLRNEALAYSKNPSLFLDKIDKIYFAGGTLDGSRDTNVKRDTVATRIITESKIPIVWIPCTNDRKQKLSGYQEERIEHSSSQVCEFLTGLLIDWREFRGEKWLERTDQLKGQGKNLWSIPAFSQIALKDSFNIEFVSGTMTFDNIRWTNFEENMNGEDMLLIGLNKEEITEWVTNTIISYKNNSNE